jgi:hypothetical protein
MERNDTGGVIFAGGAVIVVVILGLCLKLIKALFLELGRTFDAFSLMAQSLLELLFHFAIDASLIACVVAAIYFTYRYILMVNKATALQRAVDQRLRDFSYELDMKYREFKAGVESKVRYLERELHEALKEPEPTAIDDAITIDAARLLPTQPMPESTQGEAAESDTRSETIEESMNKGDEDSVDMNQLTQSY